MWAEERDISGEGAGILWKWWDWVANGDFLEDLGLMKNGELGYVFAMR
jgi:E3 ubiquitin-protein ligase RNF14